VTLSESERGGADDAGQALSGVANPHCLEQLVQAAPTRGLMAGEDVYDQRGLLLVARGQPVDAGTRERLIARRLARPLEESLEFRDRIQVPELLACARQALDEMPALARLLGAELQPVLAILAQVRLHGGPATLLTALAHNRPAALRHALAVAMITTWLACTLERRAQDQLDAAEAGLLHDLGEFHLAPSTLEPSARLSFEQWRTLGLHPVVGSALVREAGRYSPQVVTAIREHHERVDGSGYPAGTTTISPLGRLLLSAEMLATVLAGRDHPLVRARIALRMIPGQFPREVVDAVSERVRVLPQREAPELVDAAWLHAQVSLFLQRLEAAAAALQALPPALATAEEGALQEALLQHVRRYTAALHESGAHAMTANPGWLADDPQIADEVYRVTREMAWQLPGLHRHAELRIRTRTGDPARWQGVLDALDVVDTLAAMAIANAAEFGQDPEAATPVAAPPAASAGVGDASTDADADQDMVLDKPDGGDANRTSSQDEM
jgi:hypothetical protein